MIWLISLWIAMTVIEGLLCGGWVPRSRSLRTVLTVLVLIASLGSVVWLTALDWQVWLWVLLIGGYRAINLLRVRAGRLSEQQLHRVSLRAFRWLVGAQVVVAVLAWLTVRYQFGSVLLDVLVAAQFLCAITLLRASLHTWRHAGTVSNVATLSDKELPALSVLVPARNETDALESCLQQLIVSDYPKLEVLVLDDCSANRRTPEIIRSFAHDGVRFIQGEVPDETRWLAKNQAYDRLAQEASGELLLFCGVDAQLEPQSLRRLVEVLIARDKDMLSVLPLRSESVRRTVSLLQPMRYYWEICLPRRFFKRPPVLSTCWLIKKEALERAGGFESVARSVTPEAHFARQAVVTDAYSFIRSDEALGVYSAKPNDEQYATSVRMRYPQLHRRLELVVFTAAFELIFLLGPAIGLTLLGLLGQQMAYAAAWSVALLCIFITYYLVAVGTKLNNLWLAWLLMPVAFITDVAMLHISLWKYEFSSVEWKGRNVCVPVMQIEPRLPKL